MSPKTRGKSDGPTNEIRSTKSKSSCIEPENSVKVLIAKEAPLVMSNEEGSFQPFIEQDNLAASNSQLAERSFEIIKLDDSDEQEEVPIPMEKSCSVESTYSKAGAKCAKTQQLLKKVVENISASSSPDYEFNFPSE